MPHQRTAIPVEGSPLTPMQRDIHLEQVQLGGGAVSSIAGEVELEAGTDLDLWEAAVRHVAAHDRTLLSRLVVLEQGLRQVPDPLGAPLLCREPPAEPGLTLGEQIARLAATPRDVSAGASFQHWLVPEGRDGRWHAVFGTSHVFSDGHTLRILFERTGQVYEALRSGDSPPPFLQPDFYDYLTRHVPPPLSKASRDFWQARLADVEPLLFAPAPVETSGQGQSVVLPLDLTTEETQVLLQGCSRLGCSLPTLLASAWIVALESVRLPGGGDWLLHCMHAGRPAGYRETPGCFAQAEPWRVRPGDLEARRPIAEFLLDPMAGRVEVRRACGGAHWPSMLELHEMTPQEGARALFNFHDFTSPVLLGRARELHVCGARPDHEIQLVARVRRGCLELRHHHHTRCFNDPRVLERVRHLAFQLVDPASLTLGDTRWLLPDEERCCLELSAGPAVALSEGTVDGAFAAQALRSPEAVAVTCGAGSWTYRELDHRSRLIAQRLLELGVTRGSRVAVLAERRMEMVAGLLGILRTGAAYVPLDPAHPLERIRWMIADSGADLLLCHHHLLPQDVWNLPPSLTLPEGGPAEVPDPLPPEPAPTATQEDPAYLIYTSGSTGQPKGVVITHRNLANFLTWAVGAFGAGRLHGMLASTSLSFDLSVFEIFAPLVCGGSIILSRNALELPDLPAAGQVRVINTVPSVARELLRCGSLPPSVGTVILAGELLDQDLVEGLLKEEGVTEVFDCYGPSETTTYSTWVRRVAGGRATIGRPVANTQLYVVNRHGRLVPPGTLGELWIGGEGVAAGYWNRPELARDRFTSNPFEPGSGRRVYHTGDMGRLLGDGDFELKGRIDQQIKIRGIRVEPGETEAVLRQHPAVRDAAVAAIRHDSGMHLVAYVAVQEGGPPPADLLRRHVAGLLPEVQVPTHVLLLDELPFLPNGKRDWGRLRRLPLPRPEICPATHETPTSREVARMWCSLLGVSEVAWDADFFQLGGDSLDAVQAVWMARRHFHKPIPQPSIFAHPTLGGFSCLIDAESAAPAEPVPPPGAVPSPSFPLGALQKPFWMLQALAPESCSSHLCQISRWKGALSRQALERALQQCVERHPLLTARVVHQEDGPAHHLTPEPSAPLVWEDLGTVPEDEQETRLRELLEQHQRAPFDFTSGPLCRFLLARLGPEEHVFSAVLHHMVSDEWSRRVFVRELQAGYAAHQEGRPAVWKDPPGRYETFVRQTALAEEGQTHPKLSYWTRRLRNLPPLQLPGSHPHTAVCAPAATETAHLPASLVRRLHVLGREENCTPYMTILAGVQCLLHRWTGQVDFATGMAAANRPGSGFEDTIGLFTNLLPLRARLRGRPGFRTVLRRVRFAVTRALEHQDVPHTLMASATEGGPRPGGTPLFRVVCNHVDAGALHVSLPGLESEVVPFPSLDAVFDLTIYHVEFEEGAEVRFVFRQDVLEQATVRQMAEALVTLMEAACDEPEAPVSRLPLRLRFTAPAPVVRPPAREGFCEFHTADASTIPARFEAMVGAHAARAAVTDARRTLTYAELHEDVRRLSRTLTAAKRAGNPRVAVLCHHDASMVTTLLAILSAGCTYVPLDAHHPADRWRYVVDDSEAGLLVADARFADEARHLAIGRCPLLLIGNAAPHEERDAPAESDAAQDPDAPAYLLYTSGSTGAPKGVVQSQRHVLHHIGTYVNQLRIGPGDRIAMLASYGFDAAVMDLYGALLTGASLHLYDLGTQGLRSLGPWLEQQEITILHATPTVYRAWLKHGADQQAPASIRLVVLGGEEVHAGDFASFRRCFPRGCVFVNGLGPTESTLALQHFMDHDSHLAGSRVPVGVPVPGTEVVLLDDEGRETDLYGEMAIRSPHLALGYWKLPELTQAKFPVREAGRQFLTGDLGRRLPDGTLVSCGRKDGQVKIRGVRIETGEIESQLCAHPEVRHAAVRVARDQDGGEICLDAYIVPESPPGPGPSVLRAFLARMLPGPMLPRSYTALETLPRNVNGKVDRSRLPEPVLHPPSPSPSQSPESAADAAPQSDTEHTLAGLWQQVLGRRTVDREGDFFELGGHSLQALELVDRVNEAFGRKDPVRVLFEHPTVARWAAHIDRRSGGGTACSSRSVEAASWRFLVTVREGDGDLPLFVVPGGWGGENEMVVFGGLLAAGGHRRPVYGFQSRLLDDDTPLPASVTDLAARYVAELVEKQPAGDCLLAGECVGGLIAMEMAQQLAALGRRVSRLILLDVRCPTAEVAERHRQSGRKNLERVHGSNLADRVFPYYSALCGYRPRPYAGRVDLVASEESLQRWGGCMGWDHHLQGPVRTFKAPGTHDTYIRQHRSETGVLLAGLLGESGLA